MDADRQALKIIETFRVDIVANLLFTWSDEDLAQLYMPGLIEDGDTECGLHRGVQEAA